VRPLAVARCDLDVPMAVLGLFPGPYPVGHELVAEVVDVGPDVDVQVGARVSVPFQVSCGDCATCRAGRPSACTTCRAPAGAAFGFGEQGGGHGGAVADLLAVPHADHLLLPAPAGLSDVALATLPDNALDGYRAVGPQLQERPGADVLVLAGAAPSIGLYSVALARALGAGTVRYADGDAGRCRAAERLGAQVTHLESSWPRRFERADVVVDATADAAGLLCAIRSTQDLGLLTVVGIVFGDAPVPLLEMYSRGITLHTARADSRRHLPCRAGPRRDRRLRSAGGPHHRSPLRGGRRRVAGPLPPSSCSPAEPVRGSAAASPATTARRRAIGDVALVVLVVTRRHDRAVGAQAEGVEGAGRHRDDLAPSGDLALAALVAACCEPLDLRS
jgi:alcohol dehydrogenase